MTNRRMAPFLFSTLALICLAAQTDCKPMQSGGQDAAQAEDLRAPPSPDLTVVADLTAPSQDLTQTTPKITFRIDTTKMADGKNKLAEVKMGEQVFLVGDFGPTYPMWDPQ